jgi:beta-phosphoglucomutase
MIKGILFDMDGVLVDSEELIFLAAKKMFEKNGINVSREDFQPFIGTGEDSYLSNVAKKYDFPINIERDKAITYKYYRDLADEHLYILPGVKDFILRCKKKNLKLAVATSADEFKLKVNLNKLNEISLYFDATISGSEIERKKPFPDIYIKAADKLKLNPSECLVVEDAVSGIQAARSANAKCLALTTSFSRKELSDADWICSDLSEAPDESINW